MITILKKIKNKGILGTTRILMDRVLAWDDILWVKFIFSFLRVEDNWIIFQSEDDFSDNSRALYEFLNNEYPNKFKHIWLVEKPSLYKEHEDTLFISNKSKFIIGKKIMRYYLSKSKYIFYTHGNMHRYKKKGQVVVNLWHGCGFKSRKHDGPIKDNFDYTLVTGPYYKSIHAKVFNVCEEKVLPLGLPRNSLLFERSSKAENYIDNISSGNKVIFWMPTYRKSVSNSISTETIINETGLPIFDTIESLKDLNEFLTNNNITIIVKIHHLQDMTTININNYKNIVFLTNKDLSNADLQLYEILRESDSLISDYSSVSIDYLLLDKPLAYTLDDINDYYNQRGFVMENPLEIMPGNKIYNMKDFYKYLHDFKDGIDSYSSERKIINNKVNISKLNFSHNLIEFLNL